MTFRHSTLLAFALAAAVLAAGCSDNNLEEAKVPGISTSSGAVSLRLPNTATRMESQSDIDLKNTGEVPLEIESIEWVAHPDRLVLAGDYTADTCDYDAGADNYDASGTCADATICWALTQECRNQGPPPTPLSVEPQAIEQLSPIVLPGSGDFGCPPAPTDRDVPANYCGELLIETNANTNSSDDAVQIEDGDLRIFFVYAAGSGTLEVSRESINFTGVEPGATDTRDVTLTNTAAEGDLTVQNLSIQQDADKFSVTGPESAPTSIGPGGQKTWTVEFHPPANWDEQTIGTNLEINSTATNARQKMIPITAAAQTDLPAIKVEPRVIGFDSTTQQTLTVSNDGNANLVLQSLSVKPTNVASMYNFSLDGDAIDPQFPAGDKVVGPGESRDLTVDFAAGSDPGGIGTVELNYTYYVGDDTKTDTARATLLGDVGDAPVGLVSPTALTVRTTPSDDSVSRQFVVRNVGTQPLDITSADLTANGNATADSFTVGAGTSSWTIPAGAIESIEVAYAADDDTDDNVSLTLASNTVGSPMTLLLDGRAQSPGDGQAAITANFGDDTSPVGQPAQFSALESTGFEATSLDSASWLLLSRPADSSVFVEKFGADVSFIPDVAGDYQISVIVDDGADSSQQTYTFSAE